MKLVEGYRLRLQHYPDNPSLVSVDGEICGEPDAEQVMGGLVGEVSSLGVIGVTNPREFVKKGGKIEKTAIQRVETSYRRDGSPINNKLLLPRYVTYKNASLLEGELRAAILFYFLVNRNNGGVVEAGLEACGVVNSRRCTFDELTDLPDTNEAGEVLKYINIVGQDVSIGELMGPDKNTLKKSLKNGSEIVKTYTLVANRIAGEFLAHQGIPAIFNSFCFELINVTTDNAEVEVVHKRRCLSLTPDENYPEASVTAPLRKLLCMVNLLNISRGLYDGGFRYSKKDMGGFLELINTHQAKRKNHPTQPTFDLKMQALLQLANEGFENLSQKEIEKLLFFVVNKRHHQIHDFVVRGISVLSGTSNVKSIVGNLLDHEHLPVDTREHLTMVKKELSKPKSF